MLHTLFTPLNPFTWTSALSQWYFYLNCFSNLISTYVNVYNSLTRQIDETFALKSNYRGNNAAVLLLILDSEQDKATLEYYLMYVHSVNLNYSTILTILFSSRGVPLSNSHVLFNYYRFVHSRMKGSYHFLIAEFPKILYYM